MWACIAKGLAGGFVRVARNTEQSLNHNTCNTYSFWLLISFPTTTAIVFSLGLESMNLNVCVLGLQHLLYAYTTEGRAVNESALGSFILGRRINTRKRHSRNEREGIHLS